jgi:hypothetical protein
MGNNMIKWIKRFFAKETPKAELPWPFPVERLSKDFNIKPVVKKQRLKKATTRKEKTVAKTGLYDNIHKKQERIKKEKAEGKPVEKMRKPGTKGAPTAKAFKESAKTAKGK